MYNSLDNKKGRYKYTLKYYEEMRSSLEEMIYRNYITSESEAMIYIKTYNLWYRL